jgi:D-lactate dehydrogenase
LTRFRRDMLGLFLSLPVSALYLHRHCFDLTEIFGKVSFLAIRWLGTSRLPILFTWKARIDRWANAVGLGSSFSDRVLQRVSRLLPPHLPARLRDYRNRFEHHLLLQMSDDGIGEAEEYLTAHFPSDSGDSFECTEEESASAMLHRFAAAGAAIRYRTIHAAEVEDLVSLDFALRRNDEEWIERLPSEIESQLVGTLKYGHFFCHVFHHDYLVRKGRNGDALKQALLATLDRRRAEYPAEHNVGHQYRAKPALSNFYRSLDPTNSFNPGIGQTSKRRNWA